MKKKLLSLILLGNLFLGLFCQNSKDSISSDKNYDLDEIVVTGTRNETDLRHLPMTVSVISKKLIQSSHDQSLLPVINEQVPGLFITSRGILGYGVSTGSSGGIKIRGVGGSGTTGVLILIDGHPQYMGLMAHPISDSYQSMIAERVEVLRGPASVLYGSNAMGGVINIVTEKQQDDGRKTNIRLGYGSYNTLMTEAKNQYHKGRFSNTTTASYNRTDGHRKNMEFEQFSGYTKFGYDFNDTWKTFVDANLTHFNASNPGSISSPLLDHDSDITRGMASFSLENNYEKTSGAFKFFYNWGRHEINDGYSTGGTPRDYLFNSKDVMLGVTWYQSVSLFTGNRITGGFDFQHLGGDAWNKFNDGSKTNLVNKTENEVAGYVSIRQGLGDLLTFDFGMRLDHHSRTGTEWVPQGGVALQLPYSAEIKAMISKGFRNPTIREMYMFPPQNPNLRPEKTKNYEISYSQRLLNNKLSYGLNLFYIDGKNIIDRRMVDGRPKNINIDKIENWGIETNLNYRINSAWSVSSNYSWLRMKYPVVAAPKHKLYVGTTYTKGKWDVSTGVQYINGLYTETNPDIKENFVLWNVRGSYRLHPVAALFVKGENLLAQQYEINAGYPMPKATIMVGINLNF